MKELLSFLFVIVLIAGVMWAGFIGIRYKRAPNLSDLRWFQDIATNGISVERPEDLTEILPEQGKTAVMSASDTTSGLMNMASQVLGSSIQQAPAKTETLTERAMNYARYSYCVQVVNEYEGQQSTE